MVYKLANIADLNQLPFARGRVMDILYELTSVLTYEYGADRDVDNDDGGYVLYVTPGTAHGEIKRWFNYPAHVIEYVNLAMDTEPPLCCAFYFLNNDYAVVIVMPVAEAPEEITKEIDA